MKFFLKKKITIHKNHLNKKEKKEILLLIRKENPDSILSNLSNEVLIKYLNLVDPC